MEEEHRNELVFSSQNDVTIFLDENCSSWNVRNQKSNFKDKLANATFPEELKDYINLESTLLGFWFDGIEPKREFSAVLTTGEEIGSPLPSDLKPEVLDLIVNRFENTNNPYLKARYGLILWNSVKPYKHYKYVQAALENVILALTNAECAGKLEFRNCLDLMRLAASMASVVKNSQKEITEAILERFLNKTTFDANARTQILNIIFNNSKIFRENIEEIIEGTRALFDELFQLGEYFACLHVAISAAPFAQGGKLDVKEWHIRTGQAFEKLAENRLTDDSSMVSMKFYTDAASAYQLAGDEENQNRVLNEIQKLKSKLRLTEVSTEIPSDLSNTIIEIIRNRVENLLGKEPSQIFDFLSTTDEFFPDLDEIKNKSQELETTLFDTISHINVDVNKNFQKASKGESEEDLTESEKSAYMFLLSFRIKSLVQLFIEGFSSNKITFETLQNYLEENSWITHQFDELDITGTPIKYTWQPLIIPALFEFFKQLEIFSQNDSGKQPNFVMCLDSLTLKIEGMLRELLQRSGTATLATHKKNDLREVFFDDLISLSLKQGILTSNEAIYFKFVFTPLSHNIRNNIAHSYYHLLNNYTLEKLILVILAMLRLANLKKIDQSLPG